MKLNNLIILILLFLPLSLYGKPRGTGSLEPALFFYIFEEGGERYRSAAVLMACEKNGLAKAIRYTTDYESQLMVDYYIDVLGQEDEYKNKNYSSEEIMISVQAVIHQISYYITGYAHGLKLTIEQNPELCRIGVENANKYLDE